ncbi:hypothetical protein BDB00DRAFT_787561 [Zychaea mexicana]|uniref:uncharacterized protein n=1 Tax=Zychaea mexicana TaxID=64656 RepID=UPI0022FDD8A7|nr:uncharacterized protein BDB00DRAFT_787561 [Zychaea mexicana]KAI9493884.1 hypothetical protein BDB00DRAFT_787561 [Zychaea mexicana]
MYNSEGGIELPNKMATGPGGAVSYNSEGGLVMPYHMAADSDGDMLQMPYHMNHGGNDGSSNSGDKLRQAPGQGGVSYTSEGGIVFPNSMAAQAASNNIGVSYTSEGGIVLPNSLARAADNNKGGGVSYNSEGGIVLPSHMAAGSGSGGMLDMPYRMTDGGSSNIGGEGSSGGSSNSGKMRQAPGQQNDGISYTSEGGIILPNSMAQQQGANDSQYNQGSGTFYDAETRTASCGKVHTNHDLVVALSAKQMGEDRSSKNENCGKHVEVVGPSGQQVQAEVVDYCMTCDDDGLDMTPAVFEKIADFSTQRTNIKWKFAS